MSKAKRSRRADSAIAGDVFLSRYDLTKRWGCVMRTAVTRIRQANIPEYVFSGQSVRYKVKDIEAYESQAIGQGFLKRVGQFKRKEATNQ